MTTLESATPQSELIKCHKSKLKRGGRRDGAGRKPGFESPLRKTGHKTKTARVPTHLNVQDVLEGLEMMHSLMTDAEFEIRESAARSKYDRPSNRYAKLQTLLDQMRAAFPRSYFADGRWKGDHDERLPFVLAALRSKTAKLERFSATRGDHEPR